MAAVHALARALGRIARRPSLMVPHLQAAHVGAIDYARLRALGFRAVVYDKDATLTLPCNSRRGGEQRANFLDLCDGAKTIPQWTGLGAKAGDCH